MISYWVWGGGDGGETHQYLNLFCVFKHQGLNRVVVYANEIPGCHYVKQSWLVAGILGSACCIHKSHHAQHIWVKLNY